MQEPARISVEFLAIKLSFVPILYNKRENTGRLRVREMGFSLRQGRFDRRL
jgi:hypothetical protein